MRIDKAQIITDLSSLAGDIEAGLYDTAGMAKEMDRIKEKVLALEAHEDAVSDIENAEPERRAEAQAEEIIN